MSNESKNNSATNSNLILTNKEWMAVGAVATAGFAVGGPIAAAGAVVGVVAGTCLAKEMGWVSDDSLLKA